MGFFPEISLPAPTFMEAPRKPLPWDDGVGVTALSDVVMAQSPEGTVLIRSIVSFPESCIVTFEAILRRPLQHGPGTAGSNSPSFFAKGELSTGLVLVGYELSNGSWGSNFPEEHEGHRAFLGLGGSGGMFRGKHSFVMDVPPEGDVTFWVAWPVAEISETSTTLDATPIRQAAAGSRAAT